MVYIAVVTPFLVIAINGVNILDPVTVSDLLSGH